jgi:hypothetical protein
MHSDMSQNSFQIDVMTGADGQHSNFVVSVNMRLFEKRVWAGREWKRDGEREMAVDGTVVRLMS